MPAPHSIRNLVDWITGGKRRRLETQVERFRNLHITNAEKIRREAGIPDGVELLPNGCIADPDIYLLWLIGRVATSGSPEMILDRRGITRLPGEITQLAPNLRKLCVWNQTQRVFDGIGALENLEEVELSSPAVQDLSPLANCPRLKSLKITNTGEDELASLPNLPELEQLTVGIGSVAGLSASMPKLQRLDLSTSYNVPSDILQGKPFLTITKLPNSGDEPLHATQPASIREMVRQTDALDLTDIGAMTGLTSLELAANEATDLSPLSALKNLTYLHLHAPKAASFAPLSGLTSLQTLIVPGGREVNAMPDLSWLRGCPFLTDLRIYIAPGADLTELTHLPPLENLFLGFSEAIDLSQLGTLSSVKSLHLRANTPEASVQNLALPGGLKRFSLKGRTFTSLDMISPATRLTELSLDDCGITDLTPLKTQTNLTCLGLYGSSVTDLSVLRHLPAFNAEDTNAQLNIHGGKVLEAYPSLRPYVEQTNDRDAGMNAMSNLVRAAVARVS